MARRLGSIRCSGCRINVRTCTVTVQRYTVYGMRGRLRFCRPCGEQLFKWVAEFSALMQGAVA